MGIFDIFKKKKTALTTDQKWNKMWDLWTTIQHLKVWFA